MQPVGPSIHSLAYDLANFKATSSKDFDNGLLPPNWKQKAVGAFKAFAPSRSPSRDGASDAISNYQEKLQQRKQFLAGLRQALKNEGVTVNLEPDLKRAEALIETGKFWGLIKHVTDTAYQEIEQRAQDQ